ncbi:hypothetical protein JCM1840_003285, partial [Sporobolomyces johnsonii]
KDLFPLASPSPSAATAIVPDPPVAIADDGPIQLTVDRIPAPAPTATPAAPARVPGPHLFVTPPPQPVFQREAAPSPESPDPLDFLSDLTWALMTRPSLSPSRDPRNHREALVDIDSARWLDAEKGEFFSLLNDYKVFHPVERSSVPLTAKILGGHFHYRRKGYGTTRRPGLDSTETLAPVAKFTSIRVLLALAAQQRMRIQQADVDKVYLHADLNEELHMRVPDGVDGPEWDGKVLKLDRALYGLKQAGRAWNAKIHTTLERLGYQRTVSGEVVGHAPQSESEYAPKPPRGESVDE